MSITERYLQKVLHLRWTSSISEVMGEGEEEEEGSTLREWGREVGWSQGLLGPVACCR